ncbi:MAG: sugar phosphate isomerase/epimerase family protein [Roseiflexaceae bacterium]|nr:sugar phosphate isomerase/epimerase family protein [Roseiflexaceae bacterium]
MHVGILTAPVRKQPLTELIPWAASIGAKALEVDVTPGAALDAATTSDETIAEVKALLQQHDVRISSLACYVQVVGFPRDRTDAAKASIANAIGLAHKLGVDTVCTIAGFPEPGKSKAQTIREDLPAAIRPLLELAGEQGVRIALENWFATNIQHLEHWRQVFDVLPEENFGLNFDPSHLDWQGIDVIAAVEEFQSRIFHVHAKDVSVNLAWLTRVGYNGDGWWRYTLPGYGRIRWGDFISALRGIGYDGVLSVEHEDSSFSPEEGFIKAVKYLNTLV